MKRVLVTGASGFIGAAVTRLLIERGFDVAALLRGDGLPERLRGLDTKLKIIRGDVAHVEDWKKAAADFRPEAVIHMAWSGVAGKDKNDPAQIENVRHTMRLLEMLQGFGLKHFIGAGSQAEYGPVNRRCSEADATEPTTLYGKAKLDACRQAEAFCRAHNISFAWLRIFSTYGPGDHDYWLIPYLVKEFVGGRSPKLTDCGQLWDYLHVRDAAAAFVAVLSSGAEGMFNLGSDTAPPLRSSVEIIRDLVNPALSVDFGAVAYQPDQVMHLQADVSRLTKATGWKPQISLRDGLTETVEWYAARYK